MKQVYQYLTIKTVTDGVIKVLTLRFYARLNNGFMEVAYETQGGSILLVKDVKELTNAEVKL